MIERFIIRHQRRRRIARLIRLVNLTVALMPTVSRVAMNIATAYAKAWSGPNNR